MIKDVFQIRPRYNEVDQMGYVYHANHITYCHQARTELFRKLGINDAKLEKKGYMLPVVSFNIRYKKPARYDEVLLIKSRLVEMPKIKFCFEFEIYNQNNELVSQSTSDVALVDINTRKPMIIPEFIQDILSDYSQKELCEIVNS